LFVGSFEHPPNIDAAVRLVKGVMPSVWRELGDVNVTIVGSKPPPEVQGLAAPLVDVLGWVDDLDPLLQQTKLMVVPLGYGAGLKGKITQALGVGLPVVTTPVGAEGFENAADCMLVADTSRELAEHVIRVYTDEALWQSLSSAGQALVAEHCSLEVISERLRQLLEGTRLAA
jgi:glycosyltransferase involved in cell wall biosynthesis